MYQKEKSNKEREDEYLRQETITEAFKRSEEIYQVNGWRSLPWTERRITPPLEKEKEKVAVSMEADLMTGEMKLGQDRKFRMNPLCILFS